MNEESHVLVGCECGYRTTTYTLEDVEYFKDVGYPTCPYCGEILVLLEKQYKEI